MGIWAKYAGHRKYLSRRVADGYQRVERRLNPTVHVPKGGFEEGFSFWGVETDERRVALTFDDGPHPEHTPRLLDLLGARDIKATFFVIGENAAAHPDILRRTVEEGHEIGSHTWTHRRLTRRLTSNAVRHELQATHDVVTDTTGRLPIGIRPPFGAVTPSLIDFMDHEFGYPTVMWSLDSEDWAKSDHEAVADRVAASEPGRVILMHDVYEHTIEATPIAIDRLLDRGFAFDRLSDLMGSPEREA